MARFSLRCFPSIKTVEYVLKMHSGHHCYFTSLVLHKYVNEITLLDLMKVTPEVFSPAQHIFVNRART